MADVVTIVLAALATIVVCAMIFIVADDHRKIKTLIEAHNALATDFSTSMAFIRRFNDAVERENERSKKQ